MKWREHQKGFPHKASGKTVKWVRLKDRLWARSRISVFINFNVFKIWICWVDNAWYQLIWSVFSLQLITRVMFRSCPAKSPWNLGQFRPCPVSSGAPFWWGHSKSTGEPQYFGISWGKLGRLGSDFLGWFLGEKLGKTGSDFGIQKTRVSGPD